MDGMVHAVRQEKDTKKRLDLAEELISYFSNEDSGYQEFTDYADLFAGLATWIKAASIQVCGLLSVLSPKMCQVHFIDSSE